MAGLHASEFEPGDPGRMPIDPCPYGEPAEAPDWLLREWSLNASAAPDTFITEELDAAVFETFFSLDWPAEQDHRPLPLEAVAANLRVEAADLLVARLLRIERYEASLVAERALTAKALVDVSGGTSGDPFRIAQAPSIAASEISATLKVSARTAKGIVSEAQSLTDRASEPVLAALSEGRLSRRAAKVIMDAALPVPSAGTPRFLEAAVAVACPDDPDRTPSPAALARRLRRLAEEHAAQPLAERKARAAADRRIDLEPTSDGMCWLTAYLPLDVGAAIDTRLESVARSLQAPDEQRTVNQLRADVLADLVLGAAFHPDTMVRTDSPRTCGPVSNARSSVRPGSGVRCEVVVAIPAATLAGTADIPAEIIGYGQLDADAARLLAGEAATWTRLWVDPSTGAPLAIGRTRYTPTAAMRRFLGARDGTCRFPGCDRPAAATEADHTKEWGEGGTTEADNLALLCREHHRLKSLGYWSVEQVGSRQSDALSDALGGSTPASSAAGAAPPGALEWTSPAGLKYRTYPHADQPPPF